MRQSMGSEGQGYLTNTQGGELDLASLGRALWAKRLWIAIPTVVALVASIAVVNVVTPVYRSESRILVEAGENAYTRPEGDRNQQTDRSTVDTEAVLSQVQVLMSRDIARGVASQLELGRKSEFDGLLSGFNPVRHALVIAGLADDPGRMTAEERVLRSYFERLSTFQVDKSRVIAVQFESRDPQLAAQTANTIADLFLQYQQGAKRNQTRQASAWLGGEVEALRSKVEEAEARVESFRARSNLFIGTNNTSLTAQQLAEVNSQTASARAQMADAQSRARLLRDAIRTGRPIESGDVVNSDIIRRLNEQRAAIRAQLAEQSSTLGPRHPRIAELRSQFTDVDMQIRIEAEKLVRVLENDARLAAARLEQLSQNLDVVKRQASSANEQEVQLRVLEREAKSYRDQLEALLARYRDASARDQLTQPADARIISRATISNIPIFPKKVPTILIATLGTLILAIGCVATTALMNGAGFTPVRHGADFADEGYEPSLAAPAGIAQAQPMMPQAAPAQAAAQTYARDIVAARSIRDLASRHAAMGERGKRMVIVPIAPGVAGTGVTLALARHVAGFAQKVVMVDLDLSAPNLSAIAGGGAPGITDLLAGQASFGQIIHRDPQSRAHLVAAGRRGADLKSFLSEERLWIALDALAKTYDVVMVSVGHEASMELADRLPRLGNWAVLVGETVATDPALIAGYERLEALGLGPVTVMLADAEASAKAA